VKIYQEFEITEGALNRRRVLGPGEESEIES